ncbi:MAG TPA: type II secretion system major pseudopilin GspG [Pirellulales bacterium]|jgi:general secretion pathway protein G|nr:type II secretion system major pseudopilin GspG [Pirellulales bacterium]
MSATGARRQDRAAFTLIEVLLVLVILVIIGSIAVTNIIGAKAKADRNAAKVQVDTISKECDRFALDMGSYPNSLEMLFTNPGGAKASEWAGPYLDKEIPLDPWNNPYQIQFPGGRHPDRVDIFSWGPDGQAGTQDDIYND